MKNIGDAFDGIIEAMDATREPVERQLELPFQARIVKEHHDLGEKLIKLTEFIGSPKFKALERQDQNLLTDQQFYMIGYKHILEQRMARMSL